MQTKCFGLFYKVGEISVFHCRMHSEMIFVFLKLTFFLAVTVKDSLIWAGDASSILVKKTPEESRIRVFCLHAVMIL